MILIDAIYINDGGGKILLDYLIEYLEQSTLEIYYLLDKRIENNIPRVKRKNKVVFQSAGLIERYKFYKRNQFTFTKILCFGNLPPNIRVQAEVYTYFHNRLLIDIPSELDFKTKLMLFLKFNVLKLFKKNTDQFWVQSSVVQETLKSQLLLSDDKSKIFPFYPPLEHMEYIDRERNTFLYVSSGAKHKNHTRLINAFSDFYKKNNIGKLIITVGNQFPEVIKLIDRKKKEQVPIINIGHIPREELATYYSKSEYLIYPSVSETFGLGLIEGIEQGCKVLAADLAYTYEVCIPSLSFNPENTNAIRKAFEDATNNTLETSKPLIKNTIDEILEKLSNKSAIKY